MSYRPSRLVSTATAGHGAHPLAQPAVRRKALAVPLGRAGLSAAALTIDSIRDR